MTMQQCRNEANATSSQISQREREINKFIWKRSGQKPILKSSGFATGHRKPSGKAFRQKAQSAMEYLMTYGWAILIIAIVLVAFFSLNLFNPYTFSPKASPGSCQILRPNGPGSNIFVSAVGPTCTTNEIPQYVARFNGSGSGITVPSSSKEIFGNSSFSSSGYATCFFNVEWVCGGITTIEPNMWQFVAVSNNPPANQLNLYVGEQPVTDNGQGTNAITITAWIYPITHQNDNIVTWPILGNIFNGSIANIQVYNTSLSSSQVSALYSEGIGGTPIDLQHLVGWWPLNGNSNDYSGNGNNGVPTNVIFTSSWENGYSSP